MGGYKASERETERKRRWWEEVMEEEEEWMVEEEWGEHGSCMREG